MNTHRVWLCALFLATASVTGAEPKAGPQNLRLNQIQVIGTHNSYKQPILAPIMAQLRQIHPEHAHTLDYAHPPLDVQLDRGVRSLEIDVYYYPEDPQDLRVLHVPGIDDQSSVATWKEALETVRRWSDANPNHVPVSILVEAKDDPIEKLDIAVHLFTQESLERMDAEIRAVFSEDRLFTPDDLRRDHSTLPEAIAADGWPLLDDVRGQVFICLHERGRLAALYAEPSPVLEGRPMFLRGEAGQPWSAVFVTDDPRDPALPGQVRAGYLVRTRADANLREARENDASRREAAFSSGAHIISTDYPAGAPHPETGYVVALPDGAAARVNPVSAPGIDLLHIPQSVAR